MCSIAAKPAVRGVAMPRSVSLPGPGDPMQRDDFVWRAISCYHLRHLHFRGLAMGVQLAVPGRMARLKPRWRLPEAIPPFGDRLYLFYRLLWFSALALALLGPVAGIYDRWDRPSDNSALMLGSRLGLILDEADATSIRFPVGSETTRLGIQPGDRIVEVMGFPLRSPLPFSPKDQIVHGEDPQYLLLTNLLGGTGKIPVQMRIRSPDGHDREITVTT